MRDEEASGHHRRMFWAVSSGKKLLAAGIGIRAPTTGVYAAVERVSAAAGHSLAGRRSRRWTDSCRTLPTPPERRRGTSTTNWLRCTRYGRTLGFLTVSVGDKMTASSTTSICTTILLCLHECRGLHREVSICCESMQYASEDNLVFSQMSSVNAFPNCSC